MGCLGAARLPCTAGVCAGPGRPAWLCRGHGVDRLALVCDDARKCHTLTRTPPGASCGAGSCFSWRVGCTRCPMQCSSLCSAGPGASSLPSLKWSCCSSYFDTSFCCFACRALARHQPRSAAACGAVGVLPTTYVTATACVQVRSIVVDDFGYCRIVNGIVPLLVFTQRTS